MCLASLLKARKRQGWIDNYILNFTNALYNRPIGVKTLKLQAGGRVINMDMNNRCPSTSTGNAFRNQSLGCHRHERLSFLRPRAVQRSFNENRTCHIAIKSQDVLYVYLPRGATFCRRDKVVLVHHIQDQFYICCRQSYFGEKPNFSLIFLFEKRHSSAPIFPLRGTSG
ncbi:MAG: Uncharacterised protein [Rhodospirillaceae bacterium]|nr:MAG: Uncharacterised protein [Rhodospirillaceae bacterium]